MCYTDISCGAPTSRPSGSPSGMASGSPSGMASGRPSGSFGPSGGGRTTTRDPTVEPSASRIPTVLRVTPTTTMTTTTTTTTMPPYNARDTVTARGSYCGSSFVTALRTCEPIRSCDDDDDCPDGERCFENISCTYHASKAVITGSTGSTGDDDDDDDDGNEEEEEESTRGDANGNSGNGVEFVGANDFQENSSTTTTRTHLGVVRVGCTTTLILVLLKLVL